MSNILVANRGEIALRVLRACRELGHTCSILHSEADADTLPVRLADETVCVGPPDPGRSYMDISAVLAAAEMVGADAIHPGYGMLSENARFAEAVNDAGLTFIGPSASMIGLMGQKAEARRELAEAGMPVLPGSDGTLTELDEARQVADETGYPVMIKAAEGGGGRGIARARDEGELDEQFQRVQSEADAAFGSAEMYIEKYIPDPRHIEFQVVGDGTGDVVQFGERECSVQRRHQKLMEEGPSPALDEVRREDLARTIVDALEVLEYGSAGTLEMVMDEDGNAYVIEVNTRIQVEHPVTEMITGHDLIKIQIRTALDGQLPVEQSEVVLEGHALEVRICAEDPASGFSPQQGTVEDLVLPNGPGTRTDTYLEVGSWISPYYDSMVAKLICWDRSRDACLDRTLRALSETRIEGIRTTVPLFEWVLNEPGFRSGRYDTSYLDRTDWQTALTEEIGS